MSDTKENAGAVIHDFVEAKRKMLKSGDGGDTFDPMEPRVRALEEKFGKVESKLDTIVTDLAYLKGKFESAPTAKDFGELKGRVDSLPTTAKLATLLGIAVAAITILNNWDKISAAFVGS